jgi:hypothetical protein
MTKRESFIFLFVIPEGNLRLLLPVLFLKGGTMSNKANPSKMWSGRFRFLCYLLLSALASQLGNAQKPKDSSQQIIRPENQEMTLPGTIRLIHDYGPPGYGETPKRDAHVSYWALETNQPVMASPNSGDFDCTPTKRLKLFFAGDSLRPLLQSPAARWKDKRVVIPGKLHCADTAGEMTTIYMDADSIAAPEKH